MTVHWFVLFGNEPFPVFLVLIAMLFTPALDRLGRRGDSHHYSTSCWASTSVAAGIFDEGCHIVPKGRFDASFHSTRTDGRPANDVTSFSSEDCLTFGGDLVRQSAVLSPLYRPDIPRTQSRHPYYFVFLPFQGVFFSRD